MFYLVPPAGTPISGSELIKILLHPQSRRPAADYFTEQIKRSLSIKHCFTFNSGRTAFYFLLKALYELKGGLVEEVVIPAYTCFSAAASIAKAGLKIRLVDIDPLTMDYKYEDLQNVDRANILAIVGCNMFGIINDWVLLAHIASNKGAFLIDDAAQSMGLKYDACLSGTHGDAGFFSLGRGKNLSTYAGGILVINNDQIAEVVAKKIKDLRDPGVMDEIIMFIKLGLYSIFSRPGLYWFPDLIPFLGLGITIFHKEFSIGKLTNIQKSAGQILYNKLAELNAQRTENSRRLAEELLKSGYYEIPGYNAANCPAYLRLPILAQNSLRRDKMIKSLKKVGIGASLMYPSTIRAIPGIEKYLAGGQSDFPGAQEVVDRLIAIPTHHYLRDKDIHKIITCLNEK